MPDFTPQQDAALKAIAHWWKNDRHQSPLFRLFGYAGTGKTTLARHIAEGIDGKVLYAAFTGKAACVMRSKGCRGASTIHRLIYKPQEQNEENPTFELWNKAPASNAKLIIIDECSMVDAELARDLMSFEVPLLVLGYWWLLRRRGDRSARLASEGLVPTSAARRLRRRHIPFAFFAAKAALVRSEISRRSFSAKAA